jgi:LysM repeat protein
MNTPNPLIPQGTLNPASRGASNLRIAVVTIAAIHVVFFGGLLLQGCKRDPKTDINAGTSSGATNADAGTLVAANPSSSYGPIDATNSLYYNSASNLPSDAGSVRNDNSTAGTRAQDASAGARNSTFADPAQGTPGSGGLTAQLPLSGETKEYTVVKNDSFYKIASQNGISVSSLTKANPSVDPSRLKVGAKLKIPAPEPKSAKSAAPDDANVYTVKSGDTLTKIASRTGVSISDLRSANGLKTSRLNVGQKLKIPAKGEKAAAGSPSGGIRPIAQ